MNADRLRLAELRAALTDDFDVDIRQPRTTPTVEVRFRMTDTLRILLLTCQPAGFQPAAIGWWELRAKVPDAEGVLRMLEVVDGDLVAAVRTLAGEALTSLLADAVAQRNAQELRITTLLAASDAFASHRWPR